MDFNNNLLQVNTLGTSHDTALIKLIHEGYSLVESFIKFGSAYNSRKSTHAHLSSSSGMFAYRYNSVGWAYTTFL